MVDFHVVTPTPRLHSSYDSSALRSTGPGPSPIEFLASRKRKKFSLLVRTGEMC